MSRRLHDSISSTAGAQPCLDAYEFSWTNIEPNLNKSVARAASWQQQCGARGLKTNRRFSIQQYLNDFPEISGQHDFHP